MPIRVLITGGTIADCTQADRLIDGIEAGGLIADKGYDSNSLVNLAQSASMKVVIPPRSNRRVQREFDRAAYRLRHMVENAFLEFKQWRGIATRYAKNAKSYLAALHVRCIVMWAKIY
jgi:transposase